MAVDILRGRFDLQYDIRKRLFRHNRDVNEMCAPVYKFLDNRRTVYALSYCNNEKAAGGFHKAWRIKNSQ